MILPRLARVIGAIAALLFVVTVVWAQTVAETGGSEEAATDPGTIERVERSLGNEVAEDAELAVAKIEIEELIAALNGQRAEIAEQIDAIAATVTDLGEPSETEPGNVAAERARLREERAALTVRLNRVDEDLARAGALTEMLTERRRDLFADMLFRRQDLGAAFAAGPVTLAARSTAGLVTLVTEWVQVLVTERARGLLIAAGVVALGALVAVWLTARLNPVLAPPTPPDARPPYLSRVSRAFGLIVLRTLGFLAFGVFTFGVFERLGLIDGVIESMAAALIAALVGLQLVGSVLRVALAPKRPAWRLFDLDDRAAARLSRLAWLVALVFVLDVLFARFIAITGAPVPLMVIQNFVAAIVTGLLIIAIGNMRPGTLDRRHASAVQGDNAPGADPEGDPRGERWPVPVRWGLVATGLVLIVAALAGYIGFAQFAARQIVVTGAILATMYIGLQVGRALSAGEALGQSRLGRSMRERGEVSEAGLDRLGVLLRLIVAVLVIAVGLPLILMQWGFSVGELSAWGAATLRGFTVGSVTVSLGGILLGLLVLALGWFLVRLFTRWLDGAVLEKGRVDPGVRNSVRTIVGYVGLFVVGLFALSVAGVSFASLAVVAGALSVGIGFGLQNIVSNFVSGLILLAERPFRVGDIVETGTTLGTIQKISVRSTTIETFTKQSVIVPNSDLINGVVSNWTLGSRDTRVDIPVGVSYDADPRRVHELLLEIARAHPLALADPEPMVMFVGFGASSLDFELRFYLDNLSDKIPTANEVAYRIVERFREEGIEIPYPQTDLHVRSVPEAANDRGAAEIARRMAAGQDMAAGRDAAE